MIFISLSVPTDFVSTHGTESHPIAKETIYDKGAIEAIQD